MIIHPIWMLLLGLILIYLEFYIPGAVMGVAGSLLILSSLFLFAIEVSSPWWIALFFLLAFLGVIGVIKYALWRIPRAKASRSIYTHGNQKGYQASSFDASAIGKVGVAVTDLKPGGYIEVEGKQHQAISESGYIVAGEKVDVLRGDGESLIVIGRKNGD